MGKYALSAHIQSDKPLKALKKVTRLCRLEYEITHTTVQIEGLDGQEYNFKCANNLHD
jgi:Co/Zn/Cd efflux system component